MQDGLGVGQGGVEAGKTGAGDRVDQDRPAPARAAEPGTRAARTVTGGALGVGPARGLRPWQAVRDLGRAALVSTTKQAVQRLERRTTLCAPSTRRPQRPALHPCPGGRGARAPAYQAGRADGIAPRGDVRGKVKDVNRASPGPLALTVRPDRLRPVVPSRSHRGRRDRMRAARTRRGAVRPACYRTPR